MLNNQGTEAKYAAIITLDGTVGIKGSSDGLSCYAETQIRAEVAGVGVTNTVQIQGRLRGSTTWTTLKTITGATSDTVDVSTHDFVRYNVGVADGTGTVVASGFFFKLNAGGAGGTLASLTDVDVDPLADQDILRYESATSKWTAQAADYASRTGDLLTNEYTITNNSAGSLPLILQNLDPTGAAATVCVNDDSSGLITVGVLGSNYASSGPVQPGVSIVSANTDLLLDSAVNTVFTKVGVEVASISAAGRFTSTTIDPLPVDILSAPADVAADGRSSILYTDYTTGLNKRTKLQELPVSDPTMSMFTNMNRPLYISPSFSSILSGTTTETILTSFLVPANTMSAYDFINFKTIAFKETGASVSKTWRIRVNSSNTIAGSTVLGTFTSTATLSRTFNRKFILEGSLLYAMNTTTNSDLNSLATAWLTATFNVAVNNYFFVTAQLSVSTPDTMQILGLQVDQK